MFRNLVLVLAIIALPALSFGQSIFDDTPPTKEQQNTSPTPKRTPPPVNGGGRYGGTPHPDPTPPVEAPPPKPEPIPEPLHQSVESIGSLSIRAKQAQHEAFALAMEFQRRAVENAQILLVANREYIALKSNLEESKLALELARQNESPTIRIKASSEYNAISAREQKMRDSIIGSDATVQDAKKLIAMFVVPGTPSVATTIDADQHKEIVDAIKRRDLIAGMTVDEANRAARKVGVLFSSRDNDRIYRWNIVAQTGSHQVITESHPNIYGGAPRNVYATVADYKTVGYVQAEFIDGKLTTFSSVNLSDEVNQR